MIKTTVKIDINTKPVVDRHDRRNRRVLYKQGAYLKTTLQRAMRYSKKPSKPGQPPHARRNNPLLRKLVSFRVDEAEGLVICGPEIFGGSKVESRKPLPELLDGGGDIEMEIKGESVSAHIAPRPFTAPLFTDGGENFNKLIEKEPL